MAKSKNRKDVQLPLDLHARVKAQADRLGFPVNVMLAILVQTSVQQMERSQKEYEERE